MLAPEFTVTVGRHRDVVRLAVAGDLDLATAPVLAGHLDDVGRAGGPAVVLDLGCLTFLDSSGVVLLIGAARRAEQEGWTLSIVATPPQARHVLELCGLLDVLPLR
jgi:anti-anti-sigma factor